MDRKLTSSTAARTQRNIVKARSAPMVSIPAISDTTTMISRPARRSTTLCSGAQAALTRHQVSNIPMLNGMARKAPSP